MPRDIVPHPLSHCPELGIAKLGDRAYVAIVPPGSEAEQEEVAVGSEVMTVDGLTVPERIEEIQRYWGAGTYDATAALLLKGPEGTIVEVGLVTPEGEATTVALTRRARWASQWKGPPVAFEVTPMEWVEYGLHPSGFGYIGIRHSTVGHHRLADEFDVALEKLRDAPGLIIDLRGNGGGGSGGLYRIPARLLDRKKRHGIHLSKTGPGPKDWKRLESYMEPGGAWQYHNPVALVVDDGTASGAACLAAGLYSTGRVTTVGPRERDIGKLPGGLFGHVLLPCGVYIVFGGAYGYICNDDGESMAGPPDVYVEPTVEDLLTGSDTVLDKAVEVLEATIAKNQRPEAPPGPRREGPSRQGKPGT